MGLAYSIVILGQNDPWAIDPELKIIQFDNKMRKQLPY